MAKSGKPKKKTGIKKGLIYLCSCSTVILILLISSFNLKTYLGKQSVLGLASEAETNNLNEKTFWLDFLKDNPSYIDGWIALTKIELDLGNYQEAKLYFEKAKVIDPNSQKLKTLEEGFTPFSQ